MSSILNESSFNVQNLTQDKTKLMDAFLINFFGFLSLFKLNSNQGYIKNYENTEGKLYIKNISASNHDVSHSIRLAWDARLINTNVVNEMTKLLVLIKQKKITDTTLDENLVRNLLNKIQYSSHRPSTQVYMLIQKFHQQQITLSELAQGFYNLSKKPEFEDITSEFKDIVQKGQYTSLFNTPAPKTVKSPTPTEKALKDLSFVELKKKYEELEQKKKELEQKKKEAEEAENNSVENVVRTYIKILSASTKSSITADLLRKNNINSQNFRWDAFVKMLKPYFVNLRSGPFFEVLQQAATIISDKDKEILKNGIEKFILSTDDFYPISAALRSFKHTNTGDVLFSLNLSDKVKEDFFNKFAENLIENINTMNFDLLGKIFKNEEKLISLLIADLENKNLLKLNKVFYYCVDYFKSPFIKIINKKIGFGKILTNSYFDKKVVVEKPSSDDKFYVYDSAFDVFQNTEPEIQSILRQLADGKYVESVKIPTSKEGTISNLEQQQIFFNILGEYYIGNPDVIKNYTIDNFTPDNFIKVILHNTRQTNFFPNIIQNIGDKNRSEDKKIRNFIYEFIKKNQDYIRNALSSQIGAAGIETKNYSFLGRDASVISALKNDEIFIIDPKNTVFQKILLGKINDFDEDSFKNIFDYFKKHGAVSNYHDFFNIYFSPEDIKGRIFTLYSSTKVRIFLDKIGKEFFDFINTITSINKEFLDFLEETSAVKKSLYGIEDYPDDNFLYVSDNDVAESFDITNYEIPKILKKLGLVKFVKKVNNQNDNILLEKIAFLISESTFNSSFVKKLIDNLKIDLDNLSKYQLNNKEKSAFKNIITYISRAKWDEEENSIAQKLVNSLIEILISPINFSEFGSSEIASIFTSIFYSEYLQNDGRRKLVEATKPFFDLDDLVNTSYQFEYIIAEKDANFVRENLFEFFDKIVIRSNSAFNILLRLGYIPAKEQGIIDTIDQGLVSIGDLNFSSPDEIGGILGNIYEKFPNLKKIVAKRVKEIPLGQTNWITFLTKEIFEENKMENMLPKMEEVLFKVSNPKFLSSLNPEFKKFLLNIFQDNVLNNGKINNASYSIVSEIVRNLDKTGLQKLSKNNKPFEILNQQIKFANTFVFSEIVNALLDNKEFNNNLKDYQDLYIKTITEARDYLESNKKEKGAKKEDRERIFNKFSNTLLSYEETDRNSVRMIFDKLTAPCKKLVIGKLLQSSFIEGAREGLISGAVKPLVNIDHGRMLELFKYNKINVPSIDLRTYKTYDQIQEVKNRMETLKPLAITDLDHDDEYYLRKSIEYDVYNKYKHGGTAIQILKEFETDLPDQRKGMEEFLAEKPNSEIMETVFHGTGSVAASIILRYGFTVVARNDPSVAGRALGDGIYFSNVLDKTANYIKDAGMVRRSTMFGKRGYIFQMRAALGERGKNYDLAGQGTNGKFQNFISPEWCVFDEKRQVRIYKTLFIELKPKSWMDSLKSKLLTEREQKILKITTFKEFLKEATIPEYKYTTTYTLVDGKIPVNETETVDFTEFDPSMFGDHVGVEIGQEGPELVIHHNYKESELYFIRYGDEILKDHEARTHYFNLLLNGYRNIEEKG